MIVDFHGMKCRYVTYRVMGETKPILFAEPMTRHCSSGCMSANRC